MERKKRSKGSEWECCYAKKNFGTVDVEMRSCGQKFVNFCTLTHAAKLVVEMLECVVPGDMAKVTHLLTSDVD